MILVMYYDAPEKSHRKSHFFLQIGSQIHVHVELSICPLFKNVYFNVSYSNNSRDMTIFNSI